MNKLKKPIHSILIVLVLGFLSYGLAFSKTLQLRKDFKESQQLLDLIIQQRDSLHVEQKRQMDLNSILNQVTLSYDSTQNNLLFQLTKYVNNSNLELREFMAPHIFYTNSEKIQTVKVTMAGNYNDISEFIFDVENELLIGRPAHYQIKKTTKKQRKKQELLLKMLIENRETLKQ